VTIEAAVWQGQLGLMTAMYCAGPLLLTALVVGTVVSVLQAVTQVQEITLVFVPKMLAVFTVLAVLGGWMLQVVVNYAVTMYEAIPTIVQ